jgi:hypothetical protein
MAKPPSYPSLTPVDTTTKPTTINRPERTGTTLKTRAAQTVLYLDPAASLALKRYALDQGVKVHDLLLEAVQEWIDRKGIRAHARVKPPKR